MTRGNEQQSARVASDLHAAQQRIIELENATHRLEQELAESKDDASKAKERAFRLWDELLAVELGQ